MINYIKYYAFCLSLICTITYSQSDAKIKFNEGIEAYNEGSYENAHELFKKAYELDEDYSKAIYNAGNAAYRNGDFENAKNHYSTYIDNQKDNKLKAEAYHNLGNLYYDKFLKDNKNAKKEMLQQNMGNQEDQIEDLHEISEVDIRGVQKQEMSVEVDPIRTQAVNVSLDDIESAINAEHQTIPGGEILSDGIRKTIRIEGEFNDAICTSP